MLNDDMVEDGACLARKSLLTLVLKTCKLYWSGNISYHNSILRIMCPLVTLEWFTSFIRNHCQKQTQEIQFPITPWHVQIYQSHLTIFLLPIQRTNNRMEWQGNIKRRYKFTSISPSINLTSLPAPVRKRFMKAVTLCTE